jgi:hypothetical protein
VSAFKKFCLILINVANCREVCSGVVFRSTQISVKVNVEV